METKSKIWALAATLVVLCAGSAQAWTGRMEGMGNPSGLVEDESDFLTHPAALSQGKGTVYYGDLGLVQENVGKWDVSADFGDDTIAQTAAGDEWNGAALIGTAFPAMAGRMGVFFQYDGNALSNGGSYKGDDAAVFGGGGGTLAGPFEVRDESNTFAGRILYARQIKETTALGGELSVGYVAEKSSVTAEYTSIESNYHWDGHLLNGFAYALPYNSHYWEAKLKASAETVIGTSKLTITPFGGCILDGDNSYDWSFGDIYYGKHEGSVSGYHVGTEAWWRLPVNQNVSIPFVARIVQTEKKRDGNGTYSLWGSTGTCDYENREHSLNIEAGGGIDARLCNDSRVAAGLYYGYIESKNDFFFTESGSAVRSADYPTNPKWKEHRVTLKLAAEKELRSETTLTGGLNCYYGWVGQDFDRVRTNLGGSEFYALGFDGNTRGIDLSAGMTVRYNHFTLEPYLKGGCQSLDTSERNGSSHTGALAVADYEKTLWTIGGGLAVKFD